MRQVGGRWATVFCPQSSCTWPLIVGASGVLLAAAMPAQAVNDVASAASELPAAPTTDTSPSGDKEASRPKHDKSKAPSEDVEPLQEVVVTAQRRSEDLQRVPAAITAITSERLDELNAQTFQDYFRDVPGLSLIDYGTGNRDFTLRGMNSNGIPTNPNTTPIATVSQYYDEIPITAAGFQMDPHLVDIDRVEVLRGPQGTYYGEGALAGTIRIVTRKPVLDRFSASAETRVSHTQHGGTNESEDATLNLPVIEGIAALRVSAFYAYNSGYINAVDTNGPPPESQVSGVHTKGINTDHSTGYRAVLLIQPLESLSISAQMAHFDSRQNFGVYWPSVGDLLYPVTPCPPVLGPGTSCSGGTVTWVEPSGNLYNLTVNGDFGWASLVSSSSYARTGTALGQTELNNPPPDGPSFAMNTQNQDTFAQEVRLVSSKEWSDRWDYVVGAYYQDRDTTYAYPVFPVAYGGLPNAHSQEFKAIEKALFADAGYMITEHLQARLGVRQSQVSNAGLITIDPPPSLTQIPTHTHYTPFTGRAVIDYFINRDTMAYASVARGFRNGNINDTTINYNPQISSAPGFTPIPNASKPDTDTTYEIGWKISWPTHRANVNLAVYHTDWKDVQVLSVVGSSDGTIPPGIASAYINAPRAAVDGVELETGIELLRGLDARASWSFIDPRLTADFPLFLPGGGSVLHGKKGDTLPWVARSSGSLTLEYRHHAVADFEGFTVANAQYVGPRATDFNQTLDTPPPQGTSPVFVPTYSALASYWSSSWQLGMENTQWRIALYVDNLANQRPDIFHAGQPALGYYTDRPRTAGLWLRYKFH